MGNAISINIFGGRQKISMEPTGVDFYSPTVLFLSNPHHLMGDPWIPNAVQPPMVKTGALLVQHRDDEGLHSAIVTLTQTSIEISDFGENSLIVLSPFNVCMKAEEGDIKAEDCMEHIIIASGGSRVDTKAEGRCTFWFHSPIKMHTFYFSASSPKERDEWVAALNHNVEHLRSEATAQKMVTLLCKATLEAHGCGLLETQSKVRRIKQALRLRYREPWNNLPEGTLYKAVRSIEKRRVNLLTNLMVFEGLSPAAKLPESMGGHSLLIVAVLESAGDCFDALLGMEECDIDAQNADGDTALIICARLGHNQKASKLLERGCDMLLKNAFGEDARSQADGLLAPLLMKPVGEPIKLPEESSIMRRLRARATAVNGSMGDDMPVDREHNDEDPFGHDIVFRPAKKSHFCPFTPVGRQRVVRHTSQLDRYDATKGYEPRRASLLDWVSGKVLPAVKEEEVVVYSRKSQFRGSIHSDSRRGSGFFNLNGSFKGMSSLASPSKRSSAEKTTSTTMKKPNELKLSPEFQQKLSLLPGLEQPTVDVQLGFDHSPRSSAVETSATPPVSPLKSLMLPTRHSLPPPLQGTLSTLEQTSAVELPGRGPIPSLVASGVSGALESGAHPSDISGALVGSASDAKVKIVNGGSLRESEVGSLQPCAVPILVIEERLVSKDGPSPRVASPGTNSASFALGNLVTAPRQARAPSSLETSSLALGTGKQRENEELQVPGRGKGDIYVPEYGAFLSLPPPNSVTSRAPREEKEIQDRMMSLRQKIRDMSGVEVSVGSDPASPESDWKNAALSKLPHLYDRSGPEMA